MPSRTSFKKNMYFSLYKTSSHFLAPVYAMIGHKIVPKKKKNCKKKIIIIFWIYKTVTWFEIVMGVLTSSAEESNFHDNQAHEQYKEVTFKHRITQ